MRIVHAVTHFDLLTGSGLYVYESARVAARRGYDVAVVGRHIGGELTARTLAAGVAVHDRDDLPETPPDVLHIHQDDPGLRCLDRWPQAAVVATVHSPYPADEPIRSSRVHTYICVRPEIRRKIIERDAVPRGRTAVIFNGVDRARFRPVPAVEHERPVVLFAATMSPLRAPAVRHLLERGARDGFVVLLLGLGEPADVGALGERARWERREEWHVEGYVQDCDQVAGTSLGRSTIEGWMCGKPAWIYEIAPFQGITSVTLHEPPPAALLDLFDIEFVVDQLEQVYVRAVAARH